MAAQLIGVTGATGGLGGRVAQRLARDGIAQRLIVRDEDRAPRLEGAEVVEAPGYHDRDAMRRAFEGVDILMLVSAAADAGVARIVYTSFVGAAPDATFTFARDHFHTEEHIRSRGVGHTFVRSSM